MTSLRWFRVLLSSRFAVGTLLLGSSFALPASAQMQPQPQPQPQTQTRDLAQPASLGPDVLDAMAKVEREHGQLSGQAAKALFPLVQHLHQQRRYDEAIAVAERILKIRVVVYGQEQVEVAGAMVMLAQLHESASRFALALPLFQGSLAIYERKLGPEHVEAAATLNDLAGLHRNMGQYAKALPLYQRSLAIYEKQLGPDHVDVAESLGNLAELAYSMDQYTYALSLGQRSLAIWEKNLGPEHTTVGASLKDLAATYRVLGKVDQALQLYQRSLAILERQPGTAQVELAASLNGLASLQHTLGQYAEALPLYQRSLAILEKRLGPQHVDVALSAKNLAGTYRMLGKYDQALPLYQRSLAILDVQPVAYPIELSKSLNGLAAIFVDSGKYAEALPLYRRSLAIGEEHLGPDHLNLAQTLSNIAQLYVTMGEYSQALPLYERSLTIRENRLGPEHVDVAASLDGLAVLYAKMGQHSQALSLYKRGLAIQENRLGPEHVDMAATLNGLAVLYATMGQHSQALPLSQRSLAIREKQLGPEHPEVAKALSNLAMMHLSTDSYAQALPLLLRSVSIAAASAGGADLLWSVQGVLGRLHLRQGEPELAIFWGKQAVNGLQTVRKSLGSLDQELQTSLIKSRTWPYTQLAEVLISEGRIPEAQQVLQMLKERELYDDMLRAEQSAPSSLQATLVGVERAKHDQFYRMRDQQVALANERRQIQAVPGPERSPLEKRRLAEIDKQFESARTAMNQFMASLQQELKGMRRGEAATAPGVATTQSRLRNVVEDMAAPGAEPNARAVALQYVVTDKRVSIILTVPGGPEVARQVDIDYGRLAKLITQFTEDVKSSKKPLEGDKGLHAQARELHRLLIEPILPDLKKANARTVMLSLTDVLRFMPFAALHDGKRYLIEDYTLSLFNEAATKLEWPRRAKWRVAGFGLSEPVGRLAALTEVPVELNAVTRPWAGSGMWLNNVPNSPFTLDTLQSALSGSHDVLHLASHFVVELGNTTGSRLYLGDKSTLSLEQIRGRGMRFNRIDLVTLSACETAVGGGRTSYGQEMESLGATVQRSGAAAVIATLWKVADRSTGSLMAKFYETKSQGANKAESLREAQLALLKGQVRLNTKRDWSHPFYWAPFVLMGNWR